MDVVRTHIKNKMWKDYKLWGRQYAYQEAKKAINDGFISRTYVFNYLKKLENSGPGGLLAWTVKGCMKFFLGFAAVSAMIYFKTEIEFGYKYYTRLFHDEN